MNWTPFSTEWGWVEVRQDYDEGVVYIRRLDEKRRERFIRFTSGWIEQRYGSVPEMVRRESEMLFW